MIAALSHRLMLRLMRSRAERHSGCRIDLARLRTDPEYASAIRALAQFTLDEELRALGASAVIEPSAAGSEPLAMATILPFRRPVGA